MHTITTRHAGREARIHHNPDWSGMVKVTWQDWNSTEHEVEVPGEVFRSAIEESAKRGWTAPRFPTVAERLVQYRCAALSALAGIATGRPVGAEQLVDNVEAQAHAMLAAERAPKESEIK